MFWVIVLWCISFQMMVAAQEEEKVNYATSDCRQNVSCFCLPKKLQATAMTDDNSRLIHFLFSYAQTLM